MSIDFKSDVTALCAADMASGAVNRYEAVTEEEEASHLGLTEATLDEESVDLQHGEPAHHARRPMNAFLIFCKRHRGVVRDRYPHLENRSITKILGEWWANLEPSEKASYTELARQYKEAFLRANPDFKWYKLPAPPLRTLMTRPSNQNKPHKLECQLTCGPITPGKLADESQMGGLSSLLASLPSAPTTSSAPSTPTTPPTPTSPTVPKPPKKRYLQETLGQLDVTTTHDVHQLDFDSVPVMGFTSTNNSIVNEPSSYPSDHKVSTTTVTYLSPFTKLRSHAAVQLSSLQERKLNRRRNSTDINIKSKEGKTNRDSFYKARTPVLTVKASKEETVSSKKKSSRSGTTETTIKASQQQIIDRVVDRLCGFSEQQCPSSPPAPLSPTAGNTAFPMPAKSVTTKSPPEEQRSAAQATTTSDQVLTSIPITKSQMKMGVKPSLTFISNHKKLSVTTENKPATLPAWSLSQTHFESKTINNNVYINKSGTFGQCSEAKVRETNCKMVECSGNSTLFDTNQSSNGNTQDYSLNIFATNLLNVNYVQDSAFSGNCDNSNGTFNSSTNSNFEGSLSFSASVNSSRTEFSGSDVAIDCHDMLQTESKLRSVESSNKVIDESDENRCSMPSGNLKKNTPSLQKKLCTTKVHDKCVQDNINVQSKECYFDIKEEKNAELVPTFKKDRADLPEIKSIISSTVYSKKETLILMPVKLCSDICSTTLSQPLLNTSDSHMKEEDSSNIRESEQHANLVPKPELCNDNVSESPEAKLMDYKVGLYSELHMETNSNEKSVFSNSNCALLTTDTKKTTDDHLVYPKIFTIFRSGEVDTETTEIKEFNSIASFPDSDIISVLNKSDIVQKNLSVVSPNSSNDNLSHTLRPKTLCVTNNDTTMRTSKNSISEEDLPIGNQSSLSEATRRKSLRTCKGQRYREFMNEGRLAMGKRSRRNQACYNEGSGDLCAISNTLISPRDRLDSGSSSTSEKTDSVFSECSRDLELETQPTRGKSVLESSPASPKHNVCVKPSLQETPKSLQTAGERKARKHSETSEESYSDSSPKKMFRAADFNLDEKIEALPSLSLEEFQLKKKAKKKRIPLLAKRTGASVIDTIETAVCVSTSVLAVASADREHPVQKTVLVGSQKRKARKQSITRLDTDNARARRDTAVVEPDVLNNIGLATLAEVASAKRKLMK